MPIWFLVVVGIQITWLNIKTHKLAFDINLRIQNHLNLKSRFFFVGARQGFVFERDSTITFTDGEAGEPDTYRNSIENNIYKPLDLYAGMDFKYFGIYAGPRFVSLNNLLAGLRVGPTSSAYVTFDINGGFPLYSGIAQVSLGLGRKINNYNVWAGLTLGTGIDGFNLKIIHLFD